MYEMLSGQPPFTGNSRAEVMIKHVSERPRPLPELGGVERIVHQLLEKAPERRPKDADATRRLLERFLSGAPVPEAPPSPGPEPAPFPVLHDDSLTSELAWTDWAREASIEPYGYDGIEDPMGPGMSWSPETPTPGPEERLDDQVRMALARDLTIDEEALLFEPSIGASEVPPPRRKDEVTQIDMLAEGEPDAEPTQLEAAPEPFDGPLVPLPPMEPVPALVHDDLQLEPAMRRTAPRGASFPSLQFEAPVEESVAVPLPVMRRPADATLTDVEASAASEAPTRSAQPVYEAAPLQIANDPTDPIQRPKRRSTGVLETGGPGLSSPSSDPVYVDEAPTVASASGPIPVVPVSLTDEDSDIGGLGREPLAYVTAAPHELSGIDEESTSAVGRRRRKRASHPIRGASLTERWVLPLTIAALLLASFALAGALILEARGVSLPAWDSLWADP